MQRFHPNSWVVYPKEKRRSNILLFLGEVAQVQIKAKTYFGARHGLETLSQLISYDEIRQKLQMHKNASIVDKPAYVHRGLLIDTSRNFYRYDYLVSFITKNNSRKNT